MTGFKTGTPTKDGNYKVLVKWNEGGNIIDDNDYSVLSLQFINDTWYDFKNGGLTADNGFSYDILGWTEEESQWHTGKPTEEEWYLITNGEKEYPFDTAYWLTGEECFCCRNCIDKEDIVAWRKIEPFKGV